MTIPAGGTIAPLVDIIGGMTFDASRGELGGGHCGGVTGCALQ